LTNQRTSGALCALNSVCFPGVPVWTRWARQCRRGCLQVGAEHRVRSSPTCPTKPSLLPYTLWLTSNVALSIQLQQYPAAFFWTIIKKKAICPHNRPWRPIGLWDVKNPTLSRPAMANLIPLEGQI
jgi:hypothetical protein